MIALASIGEKNLWALDILAEEGFIYDSSIYPTQILVHSGFKSTSKTNQLGNGLWEVPLATIDFSIFKAPMAGGFYCRSLPRLLFKAAMKYNNFNGIANNIYFHPWEFELNYPRLELPFAKRFIQYHNLKTVEPKVTDLLRNFEFVTITEHLQKHYKEKP